MKKNIINQIPTMTATNSSKSADINIYGPIIDSSWWNDGVTTPKQIQDKLSNLGNVSQINVHINSPGGSVFAGQAIHNMFRQHPANVTMYIDGLAASIASVIAMAGNKIVMPPGAMMMIHNPLFNLWGAYEASEMREMAAVLDKLKESLVATYMSRKTQKSKDEIIELMNKTTWMTAADAVEKGFADEVEGAQQISASMAGSVLNIAGLSFDLSCFDTLPSFFNSVPVVVATPEPQNITTHKEEKKLPDINNLEELRKEYPDLVNQLVSNAINEALAKEKQRLAALDTLNDTQNPAINELIQDAKNAGKTVEDIKGVVDILKKHPPAAAPAQNKGQEFLIAAINGSKQSGVENIQTDAAGAATEAQELAAAVNFMAQGLNQKAGKDGK